MNARGQAKPKLLETRAEYKGEILKHFKAKSAVNARNAAGGLRLQSFSDFEVPHLIDMMQVVMDMSKVGLKSQAYTKVPAFAEAFGNTGYDDFTEWQNEKPIEKSRKITNFAPSEYWDYSKSGDENAQIYLEKCRADGRIPKFPQFQGYPGYWKLLIDFKMYNNDGVGAPQQVVQPIFDDSATAKILNEYNGGHRNLPVAQDVVDDFVRQHNFVDTTTRKGVRYEANKNDDGIMYRARNSIDPNWQSYELEEEFLREVPYGDRHLFLRSLADQTTDIANEGTKNIIITSGNTVYFFHATGYMNGTLENKIAITSKNRTKLEALRKEYLHGTHTGTETLDTWAETVWADAGRDDWHNAGVGNTGAAGQVDVLDGEEQDSDSVGRYWNNYGYNTYEEFIEAVKSGTMIMDENGDLITFDDGDGVSYQQRSTDGLSNRAILANVLSEVAQDDKEASMLKLYTDNVQRLDEQIVKFDMSVGDVNLDGRVNNIDATIILRYSVGSVTELPYEA